MARVRSRFDSIADYLTRAHGARLFRVRGRWCLGIEDATFLAMHREGLGFRLDGRTYERTLELLGARPWHPLDPNRVAPGWVLVPSVHAWRFERLAIESWRFARTVSHRRLGTTVTENRAGATPSGSGQQPPSALQASRKALEQRRRAASVALPLTEQPSVTAWAQPPGRWRQAGGWRATTALGSPHRHAIAMLWGR